jgi:hypothetical protein
MHMGFIGYFLQLIYDISRFLGYIYIVDIGYNPIPITHRIHVCYIS